MSDEKPEKEERPDPMPRSIVVGDVIMLKDGCTSYAKAYGIPHGTHWRVTGQSEVQGRRRLHVDDTPSMIWAGDARPVYGWESKERREAFAAIGKPAPRVSA